MIRYNTRAQYIQNKVDNKIMNYQAMVLDPDCLFSVQSTGTAAILSTSPCSVPNLLKTADHLKAYI